VLSVGSPACAGHAQRTVPDAFDRLQGIREFHDILYAPLDSDDFEAMVVVKVDMLRGNDQFLIVMLEIGYLAQEFPRVVIVDIGDGACDVSARLPLLVKQLLPDHVTDGLRAIGVFPAADPVIEFFQQGFFQRNPEAD